MLRAGAALAVRTDFELVARGRGVFAAGDLAAALAAGADAPLRDVFLAAVVFADADLPVVDVVDLVALEDDDVADVAEVVFFLPTDFAVVPPAVFLAPAVGDLDVFVACVDRDERPVVFAVCGDSAVV